MRLIRRKDIKAKTGFCPHWCVILEKRGEFPKRVRLGPKSVGWLEEEVDRWIAARPRLDATDAAA